MFFKTTEIEHETPSHQLHIDKFVCNIDIKQFQIDYKKFSTLCRQDCRNYGSKYSCPPYSPSLHQFANKKKNAKIICYRLNLNQYELLPIFQRIRAGNAVLKSIIDRELLYLRQKKFLVAGSGSCRACRPCKAKLSEPCQKPKRMIFSLEALGVNVDSLVKECFEFELQWYIPNKSTPNYTCVVGAAFF